MPPFSVTLEPFQTSLPITTECPFTLSSSSKAFSATKEEFVCLAVL
ncbi:MAG: hypothetical protein II200_00370 [Bacteroidaceae bacterium]|nr:hypothetical protein [Bacteroidaceae bacterium]